MDLRNAEGAASEVVFMRARGKRHPSKGWRTFGRLRLRLIQLYRVAVTYYPLVNIWTF